MAICAAPSNLPARRTFWATQPNCGVMQDCGSDCSVAGLLVNDTGSGRSFVTTDWVRGLVLNILMTDGKLPNTPCGYRPGAQGGHWSESFRQDGQKIGTLIRKLPKSNSVRESISLTRATLQSELQRLVPVVAKSVSVTTEYLGGNSVLATIEILAPDGTIVRVGMTGARNTNAWAWS